MEKIKDDIFAPLNDPSKSSWPVKLISSIGGFFLLSSIYELFKSNTELFFFFLVTGLIFCYLGYRIQIKISTKKIMSEIDSNLYETQVISEEKLKIISEKISELILTESKTIVYECSNKLLNKKIFVPSEEGTYKAYIDLVLLELRLIYRNVEKFLKNEKETKLFKRYLTEYAKNKIIAKDNPSKYFEEDFSKIFISVFERDLLKNKDLSPEVMVIGMAIRIFALYGAPETNMEKHQPFLEQLADDILTIFENSSKQFLHEIKMVFN
jgi:hypothetical protein